MRRRVLALVVVGALVALWRWHARAASPLPAAPPPVADRIGDLRGLWAIAKDRAHAGPIGRLRIGAGILRIEGVVVDRDRQPVGGATVTLDGAFATTAGPDGAFAFEGVEDREHRIAAEAGAAWGDEAIPEVTEVTEPITVTVLQAATLRVQVIDEAGAPIAAAHVTARLREGTSGADGWVALRSVDDHDIVLDVAKAGYSAVSDVFETGDDPAATIERVVTLHPGARIAGTVVDEEGAPAAFANVTLVCGHDKRDAAADGDGAWSIDDAGACTWSATATAYAQVSAGATVVHSDGHAAATGAVVHVVTGAAIAGVVVDAHGAPVAHMRVHARWATSTEMHADAGNDGAFTLAGLAPDDYELFAYGPGVASPVVRVRVRGRGRQTVRLEVAPSGIGGVVVDEAGGPLHDVFVCARSDAPHVMGCDSSDADGRFAIPDVAPGDYVVTASRIGDRDGEPLHVHTGGAPLRIVVPAMGAVAGRVVLGGAPVPFFGVVVSTDPADIRIASGLRGVRAPDGRFREASLPPGHYTIALSGPTFRTTQVEADVRAGGTVELGDIAVEEGGVVRGRVLDPRGAPVAGALVRVTADPTLPAELGLGARIGGELSATSGADGAYVLAGIADGGGALAAGADSTGRHIPLFLVASRDGEQSDPVLFELGETLDLRLVATGAVVATVVNFVGHDQGRLHVTLARDGNEWGAAVESDGTARFELLPGDYTATLDSLGLPPQPVTVTAGATAVVWFPLSPTPVALTVHAPGCAYVMVSFPAEPQLEGAREVCRDDEVVLPALRPGTYEICSSTDNTCKTVALDGASPAVTVSF